MKALILCAGFGTRLGELCAERPKPLLEIGDSTICEHILGNLAKAGIREVFINLHYMAEAFPKHLGDGSRFGLHIHYLYEEAPKGTAGTPRDLAGALAGEDLLVHYGDIVTGHPLDSLVGLHRDRGAKATILLHKRKGSNSYAYLGDEGRVDRFVERPNEPPADEREPWVYSGVCVLSQPCLRKIPQGHAVDLPADIFPRLAGSGSLFGQRLSSYRWAVDSPARLEEVRRALSPDPVFEAQRNIG